MPKTKKKRAFIDKKSAVSFHLVHRSQRDPLIADGDAPQHVLVESNRGDDGDEGTRHRRRRHSGSELPLGIDADRSVTTSRDRVLPSKTNNTSKDEQAKYGIFYDDEYDYLQHLKVAGDSCLEPNEGFSQIKNSSADRVVPCNERKAGGLNFPSSLFQSEIEDNIGLLNRAAPIKGPRPELDPDVLDALQSDCSDCEGSEGSFDDEFVLKANVPLEEGFSESSDSDEEGRLNAFADEETKSRFTNYSMSSSVLLRNDGLTLLDDRFEKIFEEYDDEQIGALDGDDVDGYLTTGDPLIESVIDDYKATVAERDPDGTVKSNTKEQTDSSQSDIEDSSDDDDSEQMVKMFFNDKCSEKWDCESILSKNSTLYNHPYVIKEPAKPKPIKISVRTGVPRDVFGGSGLTVGNLKALNFATSVGGGPPAVTQPSERSTVISTRTKDETPEEKRHRKGTVKAMRRERRSEKKANKTAFKEEQMKQEKVLMNLERNLKGIKLR